MVYSYGIELWYMFMVYVYGLYTIYLYAICDIYIYIYIDIASYPPAILSYLSNFVYIKIFKGAPFIYIKIYNRVKLASYF